MMIQSRRYKLTGPQNVKDLIGLRSTERAKKRGASQHSTTALKLNYKRLTLLKFDHLNDETTII